MRKNAVYIVEGMDCPNCALRIENEVKKLPGIIKVQVNFLNSQLTIEFEDKPSLPQMVESSVISTGYSIKNKTTKHVDILIVKGMDCAEELRSIENHLKKMSGIKKLSFNLLANKLTVEHEITFEEIQRSLKEIGFDSIPANHTINIPSGSNWTKNSMTILTTISGIFAFLGLIIFHLNKTQSIYIPLFLISIISGGSFIGIKGWKEAKRLTLGMNFLMSIAIIGAMIIGEWTEAALVVFLFALAQLIESYSVKRVRKSIEGLINLAPNEATVKETSGNIIKPVEEISVGDIIIIRPGDRIPLDGIVTYGNSTVNQAPITGESLPVEKSPEDFVYAGSINQNGLLEVHVRKKSQHTMLARIIHLVEEAQTQKAPVQQFVEKFARYYTPTVVIIAILFATIPPLLFGGTISDWFYKALVLLVISCPCALVISTPVTIVSGLTNASRKGILIKGGMHLENFDKIKILAFDKTGTLTTGQPSVKSIKVINGYTEEKLLQIAVSLEAHSNHPLGKAILNYGTERQIEQVPVKNFVSFTGKGARGIINGETYYIGNHRLFEEKGMCEEDIHNELDKLENRSHTAILIGNEKNIVGLIAVADKIRESAPLAIKNLKNAGIKKTVMLTGDNGITAESISNEIGIDQFYAELLPEDKVRLIHQFIEDNKNVGMVGDGINDAPALAAASMGISMGASGSDTAIETADITLMKDDLKKLSYLKRLSHKTNFIIKQNIFIALFLKAIFFTLAIPGLTTLWMAVFADMGASLIVIFNGLRTLRFNQSDGTKPTLPK